MKSAAEISEGNSRRLVYLDKNLLIIFGITLMSFLGVSSINPVYTKIAQELNVSLQ